MQNTPISNTTNTLSVTQNPANLPSDFSKILTQKTPWEHLALSDEFLTQELTLIPPENLALMIKDCDEEYLPAVLPHLNSNQLQAILDFEVFKSDEINQLNLAKWINNLTQYCEFETLPEKLDALEHAIIELELAKYTRIELYDPENPPDPSDDLFYTPDFLFTISFKSAEELEPEAPISNELKQALIELINKLCLAGTQYCRQLIENAYEMIGAEVMEDVIRFRNARLSDYRLMTHQESIAYHAFLKPNLIKEQLTEHQHKNAGKPPILEYQIPTLTDATTQQTHAQENRFKPLVDFWRQNNELSISKLIKKRLAEASLDGQQALTTFDELERNICARWTYTNALAESKQTLDFCAQETFLLMNIGLDFLIDGDISKLPTVQFLPLNYLYRTGFYLVKEVILYAKSFEHAYHLKSFNQHYFLEQSLEQKIKTIGNIDPSNLLAFFKLEIKTWSELQILRTEIRYANLVFEIMFRRVQVNKANLQAIVEQKTNYEPALLTLYPLWITGFAQLMLTGQRCYEPLTREAYTSFVSTYFAQADKGQSIVEKLLVDIKNQFVLENNAFEQQAERFFQQCLLLINEDREMWQKNTRYSLTAPFSKSLLTLVRS